MFQTCSMVIAVSEDFTNVCMFRKFPSFWKTNILAKQAQFVLSKLCIFRISGTPEDLGPLVGFLIPVPTGKKTISGSTKSLLPWVTTRRSRLMPALEAGLVGVIIQSCGVC